MINLTFSISFFFRKLSKIGIGRDTCFARRISRRIEIRKNIQGVSLKITKLTVLPVKPEMGSNCSDTQMYLHHIQP